MSGENYIITVGKGGVSGRNYKGTRGGNSLIVGKNIYEKAFGGGYGGYYLYEDLIGGSSGGNYGYNGSFLIRYYLYVFTSGRSSTVERGNGMLTYYGNTGGVYISSKNNIGLGGGGGGGAGSRGESTENKNGGNGGSGYFWAITQKYYGGGGGGGGNSSGLGGIGGLGGGGNGAGGGKSATSALPNSGGGGGGALTADNLFSTNGESGIVIIAVPNSW
jgi:hypothetical protein